MFLVFHELDFQGTQEYSSKAMIFADDLHLHLTPRSDQYETFPDNVLKSSSKQLMRMFKLMSQKLLSWCKTKFS